MARISGGSATNATGGAGGSSTITSLLGLVTAGQQTMANSLPVVISSNQASFPVTIAAGSAVIGHVITDSGSVTNATLSAETTKIIGTVNIAASQTLATVTTVATVSNLSQIASTTPTFGDVTNATTITGGLNVIPVGVFNTTPAAITAGRYNQLQLDSKGSLRQVIQDAAGNIRGANVDASNRLSVTVDNIAGSLTLGTITTVGTLTSITNNVSVIGTKTNNAAAPLATNVGALVGIATAAQQLWTEGNEVLLSTNLKGSVRSIIQDAAGNDRGANVDANNNMGVVLATETSKIIGTVRNVGNIGGAYDAVTGATVPANAIFTGGIGKTALPTAVTDGQLVGNMADKFGRQVVLPQAPRDLVASQATTIAVNTETTIITAGAAGVFNDILSVNIVNTSATPVRIDIRDATAGSVITQFYAPAGDMRGISYAVPLPQTSAAANWTATVSSAVTDIRIHIQYVKNR